MFAETQLRSTYLNKSRSLSREDKLAKPYDHYKTIKSTYETETDSS